MHRLAELLHPALVVGALGGEALQHLVLADAEVVRPQGALQGAMRARVTGEQVAPDIDERVVGRGITTAHPASIVATARISCIRRILQLQNMLLHVTLGAHDFLLPFLNAQMGRVRLGTDGRAVRRAVPRRPRRVHGWHGAAVDRIRPRPDYLAAAVDRVGLRPGLRRLPAARRTRGGPPRPSPRAADRACRLYGRIGARRRRQRRHAARAHALLKGAAAAFTAPAGLSIITTRFAEGPERNRALSIYTATGASGFSLGLVAGGVLTELGWRWTFLLPVPIAALLLALGPRFLPRDGPSLTERRGFDIRGAVTLTAGMLLLVRTVVEAPQSGWGSPE